MKKIIIFFFILKYSLIFSQNFKDTIVTKTGDTIKCKITFINDNNIYFDISGNNNLNHEFFSLLKVKKYIITKGIQSEIPKEKTDTLIDQRKYNRLLAIRRQFKTDSIANTRLLKESAFFELLGNATLYSLNFERVIFHKNVFSMTCRIGGEFLFSAHDDYNTTQVVMPLLLNGIFRLSKRIYGEFGVGAGYFYYTELNHYQMPAIARKSYNNIYLTSVTGIRYQDETGYLLRIGFTPMISFSPDTDSVIYSKLGFGLSFGYSFE